MPPSLNDLPDLCLLTVFKYLSLLELLRTIRLVNTRWSGLLPAEMARRRSLVIVDDRRFDLSQLQLDQYQSRLIEHVKRDDGLTPWAKLPQIDSRNMLNRNTRYSDDVHISIHNQMQPEMITTLVDTLPRITSLTVVKRIVNVFSLGQITRMIDHWRDHLVTLKLYLHRQDLCFETGVGIQEHHKPLMRAQTVALFASINRAPSLRHLTLELDNFTAYNDPPFTVPLTILSQLSTLHFESFGLTQYLYHALVPYATDNQNLQIGTKNWSFELADLLGIDPLFCGRFSCVKFTIPQNGQYDSMNIFCNRFSSLVHLVISHFYYAMAITKIGQCLSKLSQLVHLSIPVYPYPPADNLPEHQRELTPDQIVPVLSVRLLSLTIYIISHSSIEHFLLPSLFPNVQVLSITSFTESCTDCGFTKNYANGSFQNGDQMRQCAQLARRPFRHFSRLHTIEIDANDSTYLSREKRLITKDEL